MRRVLALGTCAAVLCVVSTALGAPMKSGFDMGEAQAMLELCINLNGDGLKSQVSKLTNYKEDITKNFSDGYFVDASQFLPTSYGGASLDYMPVGIVIALRAKDTTTKAPREDLFWEHHLARYKQLLEGFQGAN